MRGHVIVHPQHPDIVVELLPPLINDIIAPICVIYTGSNAPTAEWLRKKAKPLLVRADKVCRALLWLKASLPLCSPFLPLPHCLPLPPPSLPTTLLLFNVVK